MNSTLNVASLTTTKTVEIAQMLTSRIGKKRLLLSLAATMACLQAATAAAPSYTRKANAVLEGRTRTDAGLRRRLPSTTQSSVSADHNAEKGTDAAGDVVVVLHSKNTPKGDLEETNQTPGAAGETGTPKEEDTVVGNQCLNCGGSGYVRWNNVGWEGINEETYIRLKNLKYHQHAEQGKRWEYTKRLFRTATFRHNADDVMVCQYCDAKSVAKKGQNVLLGSALGLGAASVGLMGYQMGESIQNYVRTEESSIYDSEGLLLEGVMVFAILLGVAAIILLAVFLGRSAGPLKEHKALIGAVVCISGSLITGMVCTMNATTMDGFTIAGKGAWDEGNADKLNIYSWCIVAGVFFLIGMCCLGYHLRKNAGWGKLRSMHTVIGVFGGTGLALATGLMLQEGIEDVHTGGDEGAHNFGANPFGIALFAVASLLVVYALWYMITGERKAGITSWIGGLTMGASAACLTFGLCQLQKYGSDNVIPEAADTATAEYDATYDAADNIESFILGDGMAVIIAGALLLVGLFLTLLESNVKRCRPGVDVAVAAVGAQAK